MTPGKRRTMGHRRLFVRLGFLKGLWMDLFQPDPFNFLLKEAKRTATARSPFIVARKADSCRIEQRVHACLVNAMLAERKLNDHVFMLRGEAFAMVLIGSDGDVAVDLVPAREPGAHPILEWK